MTASELRNPFPAEIVYYGMTKTVQIALTRGIAESVGGTGVTVNTILAGPTESEVGRRLCRGDGEAGKPKRLRSD